jgi:DNA-binding NtrC family response regulator
MSVHGRTTQQPSAPPDADRTVELDPLRDVPPSVRSFTLNVTEGESLGLRWSSVDQLDQLALPAEPARTSPPGPQVALPYDEARRQALGVFEREYSSARLRAHGDNVSAAARASGLGRIHFHRLLRRNGLR